MHARRVVLATNAYPPLLRRLRLMTVPVYDYALMTEPLTADQREAIGWRGREGISDLGNQFHYFRTTRDGRILWGGYDAIYHYGSGLKDEYDQRAETFEVLAQNFFTTFPQLAGLGFSHAWGGVIDTCTRFAAFYGTALGGRVGYALGFTGLGVGATRFAGDVLSTSSPASTPRAPGWRWSARSPCPSRPSPPAGQASKPPVAHWPAPTRTTAERTSGCRTLDRLGLGFDS